MLYGFFLVLKKKERGAFNGNKPMNVQYTTRIGDPGYNYLLTI